MSSQVTGLLTGLLLSRRLRLRLGLRLRLYWLGLRLVWLRSILRLGLLLLPEKTLCTRAAGSEAQTNKNNDRGSQHRD